MTVRDRVVKLLDGTAVPESTVDIGERLVLVLIVVNTATGVLETVEGMAAQYGPLFNAIEYVAVAVFTVEFLVRVASRVVRTRDASGIASVRELLTLYLVIDFLAIVPFYVGLTTGINEVGPSSLLRALRLFKLARYYDVVDSLGRVVRRKREDIVVSAFGTGILWLIAASSIYFAERGAQPEAFSSIPAALWWAGVTITTVGYGDVYPVTPLGRLIAVVIALLGIGLAAVPASILVSGLLEETGRSDRECPHCGRRPDE